VGKYNKAKFTGTTLRRELLRELDEIAGPGESRNDVIERLIKLYRERRAERISVKLREGVKRMPIKLRSLPSYRGSWAERL